MMLDWNEYQKEIGSRLAEFMKATPDSVRGYQMLSNANSKTTHLGEKTRRARKLPPRTIQSTTEREVRKDVAAQTSLPRKQKVLVRLVQE